MIVTFCGHSEIVEQGAVRIWLEQTISALISRGADTFYLGGYGSFDRLAASVVREQIKDSQQLQMVLVLPYLNGKIDSEGYSSTIYPPLENVPARYAIPRRNCWMVEQSDVVVAYVLHSWGGAAKTLQHAIRKHKEIVQYPASVPGK